MLVKIFKNTFLTSNNNKEKSTNLFNKLYFKKYFFLSHLFSHTHQTPHRVATLFNDCSKRSSIFQAQTVAGNPYQKMD